MAMLSKALGPQQCYEQVGGEPGEGQCEQDEIEGHGSAPLAGHEVEGQQREAADAQYQHQNVEHSVLHREGPARSLG